MITHIVLFKFDSAHQRHLQDAAEALESLLWRVPQIRSLSVGANVLPSHRAYDLGLVATFDSLEDLAGYRADPEHRIVADRVDQYCTSTVSVDYQS